MIDIDPRQSMLDNEKERVWKNTTYEEIFMRMGVTAQGIYLLSLNLIDASCHLRR